MLRVIQIACSLAVAACFHWHPSKGPSHALHSGNSVDDFPVSNRKSAIGQLTSFCRVLPLVSLFIRPFRVRSDEGVGIEELPYAYNALEPYISERTMKFHHDKHYTKYVATMKSMIEGTPLQNESIENIILKSFGKNQNLFNNAAQSWNHAFYWRCMTPSAEELYSEGKLAKAINKSFGSFDEFKTQFAAAGNSLFGSGWVWLVQSKKGDLSILKTVNANTPLTDKDLTPLLTMDVWEHAYYLDYQNVRASYVSAFLEHLIDWRYVESRMKA